jgi:hypothetical protein
VGGWVGWVVPPAAAHSRLLVHERWLWPGGQTAMWCWVGSLNGAGLLSWFCPVTWARDAQWFACLLACLLACCDRMHNLHACCACRSCVELPVPFVHPAAVCLQSCRNSWQLSCCCSGSQKWPGPAGRSVSPAPAGYLLHLLLLLFTAWNIGQHVQPPLHSECRADACVHCFWCCGCS